MAGIGFALVLGYRAVGKSPAGEMEEIRKLFLEADALHASFHCPQDYRQLRGQYEKAMQNWGKENEKWFFSRRYDDVRESTVQIRAGLKRTIRKADSLRLNSNEEIKREIRQLRLEMKTFDVIFSALPVDLKWKRQYANGKLLLNAAEIAFGKNENKTGISKGRQALPLIREAYARAHEKLQEYFSRSGLWRQEGEEAILNSRQSGSYAIVIEKFPPRCYLYEKGVKKYTFQAEFGKNWMGDKQCEGDYKTPEGHYRVKKKMQGSSTRYYKALLLDYPNATDRSEFERRKKEGSLPIHARIGGAVEIHGCGGRCANWTEGCIALKNEDMDLLYRKVKAGTPVTIIGSSRSLEEALKNYNL